MVKKIVTERFSMQGWDIKKYIKGNWSTIKEGIKIAVPLIIGMAYFRDRPELVASCVLVGKGVMDLLHYWIKQK